MYNLGINQTNYQPLQSKIAPRGENQMPQTVQTPIVQNSQNFENDYFKYQNAVGLNNQAFINTNKNYNIGRNVMNEFYEKYPKLDSFTMSETIYKGFERNNANSYLREKAKAKADKDFNTMIGILEKRPDNKDVTFNQYINIIEKEFDEYNFANCGERAYYLHNEMNKKGIDNTIIEIGVKSASNSHVFNVIGLDKNADITNPETWGENALVVDVWANKLLPPKEAVAYYKEFLNYGENNPMEFEKLDVNKIFKSN